MKICPKSTDGLHHYIVAKYMALCIVCQKEVTLTGVTEKWVKA